MEKTVFKEGRNFPVTVAIRIKDPALCRLARILTEEYALLHHTSLTFSAQAEGEISLLLCDEEERRLPVPTVTVGREKGDLCFPFPREDFFTAVEKALRGEKTPILPEILLPDGGTVTLTAGEQAIFSALARNEGRTVSHFALGVEEGSLNVLLHRLRGKLEKDGQKRLFAKRGEGYRLECKGLRFSLPGKET